MCVIDVIDSRMIIHIHLGVLSCEYRARIGILLELYEKTVYCFQGHFSKNADKNNGS